MRFGVTRILFHITPLMNISGHITVCCMIVWGFLASLITCTSTNIWESNSTVHLWGVQLMEAKSRMDTLLGWLRKINCLVKRTKVDLHCFWRNQIKKVF